MPPLPCCSSVKVRGAWVEQTNPAHLSDILLFFRLRPGGAWAKQKAERNLN